MPIVVSSPWPGSTIVSGGRVNSLRLDRLDDGGEVAPFERGVAGAAGEQRVAAEQHRSPLDLEADGALGVAGRVDGVQAEPADLDHLGVVEEDVVAEVAEAGSVELGDGHLVAGLAHGRDGLDVVPVAVGLQHPPHPEALGQLQQLLVLVGGVEQDGVTGLLAPQHEHVVVVGTDHELVDLEADVVDVQLCWPRGTVCLASIGSMENTVAARGRLDIGATCARSAPAPGMAGRPRERHRWAASASMTRSTTPTETEG